MGRGGQPAHDTRAVVLWRAAPAHAPIHPSRLPSRPADQLRLAVAEALCRTAARRNEFASAVYAVEAEDKLQK